MTTPITYSYYLLTITVNSDSLSNPYVSLDSVSLPQGTLVLDGQITAPNADSSTPVPEDSTSESSY